jgi:hypothetical protein
MKFDTNQDGRYIFTTTYSGTGNFSVWIKDTNGDDIELVADAIGSYQETKMVKLDASS